MGWNRTGTVPMSLTLSNNGTALNPCFFGQFHIFANWEHWLQLSIWVLIISQYSIYVKDAVFDALLPPILQCAIQSLFIELLWHYAKNEAFFTVTRRMLIISQIEQLEVKEHLKLHLLHIYHIVIWSKLKYLIGAKVLSSWQWGSAAY